MKQQGKATQIMLLLLLSVLTFVELNCENLFDTQHDSLKQDTEYLPDSPRRWTRTRYWRKIDNIARCIIACGRHGENWAPPDIAVLCEVENDSVMHDLTRRSLLREAGYDYVITDSPDVRGIDVALIYNPMSFRLISSYPLRVEPLHGMRRTRDILYACGELISGDTLHIFAVHSPSRYGGEAVTRSHRLCVADRLKASIDSLRLVTGDAAIIVAGDMNDYYDSPSVEFLTSECGLTDISKDAAGSHGAKASYKYNGVWSGIDHILVADNMKARIAGCRICDDEFLLEKDDKYGGLRPMRTYHGYRYLGGFSDHLPIVARFTFD